MELTVLDEVIEVLSGERRVFSYFPDRYALMLLADYIGERRVDITALKQSPFGKLLHKPLVKQALAYAGDGRLSAELLRMVWAENALNFVLTLDHWGEGNSEWQWNQMSRRGYHLVLQLNMATSHTDALKRLVDVTEPAWFNYYGHPVRREGDRETLAWVRIDLDFSTNEALIEEVQSDWVRAAHSHASRIEKWGWDDAEVQSVRKYVNVVLEPYAKVWEEAALAAAIDFIRNELGIGNIYYHSYELGAQLKHITDRLPPRSLYTHLPKRFAFQQTLEGPQFLMRERRVQKLVKRVKAPYWFALPTAA